MPEKPSPDRRVRRTRGLLHGALASLIHEKPYDDIVVKEILARADVGRSTFYAHFRDKDELLAEGIRDLLREAGSAAPPATRKTEWVLRFSAPMFEHIGRYVPANGPGLATRHEDSLHEHLEHAIAASVAERLRRAGGTEGIVRTEFLAEHVAATFVRVLEWWIAGGTRRSASEAEAAFRALVLPALRAALGER
jgi:AcrR family transcriptional regulator